ncbi:Utp14-domain-containing protein [Laetiporus sulphureus 93-53]|uniref:Utp14-domain-containing protein n=1 Tax=Laetiporus sulphureus 93-53 TaxID=1314785 RepID=A0A165FD44_9APHY|nr:Utp14-domain-containing protein [Laetiporus sulphureus 93-53]KZT08788.1 Utp14-domain-containing protein [Laetiporus sulphureus 93-53]
MARGQKPQRFAKKPHALSRKAANAAGFAKRKSLKSKTPSRDDIADVYEYQSEKVPRDKMTLQYGKEELVGVGGGSGSEDEDGDARAGKKAGRPRLVGEGEEGEQIGESEDEDIESDDAFDESDEERFAGFGLSQKKGQGSSKLKKKKSTSSSRSVRFVEVDLNEDEDEEDIEQAEEHSANGSSHDGEDEEEEEEGDPDEFIDVLDIMDGKAEPGSEDDVEGEREGDALRRTKEQASKPISSHRVDEDVDEEMDEVENGRRSGSEEEEGDEEEEEEGDDQQISGSEGEDEEANLDDLARFVTTLDVGHKRKAPDDEDQEQRSGENAARARKRRILKERTEAGAENEFAAHVGGDKLRLDDLLAPLAGQSPGQSLKRSAKILASQSGSVKTLSAPLPQRTAERLDRQAAYRQTKEEVDKWKATMQRIKEAEHLSFPLQAQPVGKTSNLELAAKFKPETEMENAVDKLLKLAKMRDEDIAHTESLKMNHLTVEEVKARRAELAKMRELMFRADAKAKRIAKIKSKTYRRLKKKDRARMAEKLGENEQDDDDEEVRLEREIERARERATLKHKNTGKWAKAMKARGELDEDQRRDIAEMLERGERLRKKIRGDPGSDEENDDEESSEDEDDEGAVERIKANAFEELAGLQGDEVALAEGSEKKGKSIFEMKFMKNAIARDQRKVDEMVDDFVREMGGPMDVDEDGGEGGVDAVEEQPYNTAMSRVGGRTTYRPGLSAAGITKSFSSLDSETSSVTLKSTDLLGSVQPESPVAGSPVARSPISECPSPSVFKEPVNPWLARAEGSSELVQKRHEIEIGKNSASAEKSKNKLRKSDKKRVEEKEKEKADATVDISVDDVLILGESSTVIGIPKKQEAAKNQKVAKKQDTASSSSASKPSIASASKPSSPSETNNGDDEDDSDANSEVEEQERLLSVKGKGKAKGVKAFEQRDLVALAFAGDNVVQDFAEEKRRETQEDAPFEVDTTLPGWGSWGGKGTKKAAPKPYLIKKVSGVDPKTRADYGKTHVIISEKRDKKAAKYLVKDLPFPYTSKAQFERSLETPIGTEWNTRLGFQRATLPRVVKKPGIIISPLEKLL